MQKNELIERNKPRNLITAILLGKRYFRITNINEKARYMTMNAIFMIVLVPLFILGVILMKEDTVRSTIDFIIAGICLLILILMRTKISLKILPIIPVTVFGAYCLYLIYNGGLYMWLSVWFFSFPLITIFLCQMVIGLIQSVICLITTFIFLYTPIAPVYNIDPQIKFRFLIGYLLILFLTIIFERINILKDRKEEKLNAELVYERDNLKIEIDKATNEISGHLRKATDNGKQLNKVIIESSQALGIIKENMEITMAETNTQFKSVEFASDHVAEIAKSIISLEEAVASQASHIGTSSSSIEQMVANNDSIRSIASEISKTANTLSQSSAFGNSMLQKLTEEVEHLHKRSDMLQNANKIIDDIAAKTNLLAMNAAIEAAHAGEAGRGFAVVASEVRKLAESAINESKGISEEINKMEQSIKSISGVTEKTVQSMNLIFNEITAMDSAFTHVNKAVEEQASGGAQIIAALKSIQEETERVRNGSKDMHAQSSSISNEMHKLHQISESVTKRVNEVNEASGKISSFLDNAKKIVAT